MTIEYEYPIKHSPKSDPQQYRVYRMENEAIGARSYMRLTRKTMRQIARSVCRNYHVPMVRIEWRDLGRWAAEWDNGLIRLNTNKETASDLITLTHELAHHLHYSFGGDNDQESHGPEFMACHMSILDTLRIIPVVGMREICRAWKIRFADPGTTNSLRKLQLAVIGRGSRKASAPLPAAQLGHLKRLPEL